MTKRVCIRCGTRYPANSECPHHPREARPAWRTTTRSRHERGLGNDHYKIRRLILAAHPICEYCGVNPSTIADHRINRARGGTNAPGNYAACCSDCHKRKTAREAHA